MSGKERLSASVDAELLAAAQAAVERGEAESVSAWVNEALRLKADHDRRLAALDGFLAAYEAENGVISAQEMHDAARRARAAAVVVRGRPAGTQAGASGARGAS
jgi:Arc/MetJ-type ribon-helix-helix transcriptional regulator